METPRDRRSLLAELETLQNAVFARLDDLDRRVSAVLKQWGRTGQNSPASPAPHQIEREPREHSEPRQ